MPLTELSEWAQVILARTGTANEPAIIQALVNLLADLARIPSSSDPSQSKLDRIMPLLAADTDEAADLAAELLDAIGANTDANGANWVSFSLQLGWVKARNLL